MNSSSMTRSGRLELVTGARMFLFVHNHVPLGVLLDDHRVVLSSLTRLQG